MKLSPLYLLLLLLPATANSATLRVPSEYPTIQAGLDAAASGDTVLVAPGTYTDFEVRGLRTACVFLKGGVALRSESGPQVTTIDMQGQGTTQPNVVLGQFLTEEAVVQGFTITGQPFGRSGMYFNESARVTVEDCILRDMDAGPTGAGGGIQARLGDLTVIGCEFVNCHALRGGGIYQLEAVIEVLNSTFRACGSAAIWLFGEFGGGEAHIQNCAFVENVGANGAIASSVYRDIVIEGCHFERNVAQQFRGAAVGIFGGTTRIIRDSVFLNNRLEVTSASGGAIAVSGGGTVYGIVERNTLYGNSQTGPSGGSSVYFQGGLWDFRNNIIAVSEGSAAILNLDATVLSSCNVFWENASGNGNGYDLGPTDQEVDPLFCDPENGDLTVSAKSPCLPENSGECGQIGALGQGCGAVSVEDRSWGSVKAAYR
jgi:hypothetical protein